MLWQINAVLEYFLAKSTMYVTLQWQRRIYLNFLLLALAHNEPGYLNT